MLRSATNLINFPSVMSAISTESKKKKFRLILYRTSDLIWKLWTWKNMLINQWHVFDGIVKSSAAKGLNKIGISFCQTWTHFETLSNTHLQDAQIAQGACCACVKLQYYQHCGKNTILRIRLLMSAQFPVSLHSFDFSSEFWFDSDSAIPIWCAAAFALSCGECRKLGIPTSSWNILSFHQNDC